MKIRTLTLFSFFLTSFLQGQNLDTLPAVDTEVLARAYYPDDRDAPAYYLLKSKKVFYRKRGNKTEQVTVVHEKLQIFSAKGYEYATINIQLLELNGVKERLDNFQGVTYSLDVNGEVENTRVDIQNVLTSNLSDNFVGKSITMPQVGIGSIIEYSYTVVSPFLYDIPTIEVQSAIPVEELVAEIAVLDEQKVNVFQKGLYDFKIEVDTLLSPGLFKPIRNFSIHQKNIPAMVQEPLMGDINLFLATLEFNVFGYVDLGRGVIEEFPNTWEKVLLEYNSNDDFQYAQKARSFYKEDLIQSDSITGVMSLVRNKIKWNEQFGAIAEYGIRDAYRLGKGNVADMNLTLLSMLRSLGIESYPVFTSSKFNGPIFFPKSDAFDYLIVAVKNGEEYIYLDASDKYVGINDLPSWIQNSEAFILKSKKEIERVVLNKSSPGISTTLLSYDINDRGIVTGKLQRRMMNYFAADFRAEYDEKYQPFIGDLSLDSYEVKNLDLVFEPLVERISFHGDQDVYKAEKEISFVPLLFESIKDQLFEATTRITPIEFGNKFNQRYVVQVELPEQYTIKSAPIKKSYLLPENLGQIDFESSSVKNQYKLILNFQINSPVISSEYYPYLVEYFEFLIKYTNEKVVFEKKEI